jgi:membrane fusion protein (multidrug efflux system)
VSFTEGAAIAKGALMVNISTGMLRVRRDQARSDYTLAQSELSRADKLAEKKLIAPAELDQVRNRREAAFHAMRLAQIELDKSIVRAPLAGVVKTKAVSVGEYLAKGEAIGEILSVRKLKARITVPENDIRYFSTEKRVTARLDALPDERFEGTVTTVGIEADPANRSFPVEIEIGNEQGRMRPGMLARVEVNLVSHRGQLLIPRHSVLEREGRRIVYVIENGQAVERTIGTGASADNQVQVLNGLSEGDELIVTGQQRLGVNTAVKVSRVIEDLSVTDGGSPQ